VLFPVIYFFTKNRFSMLKVSGVYVLVAMLFLSVHLYGVLDTGSHSLNKVHTQKELQEKKSKLYVSHFLMKQAERNVSSERQKLLRREFSKLDDFKPVK